VVSCSWDTRDAKTPCYRAEAHEREILSVAFSPASEYLLITGSADKVRNMAQLMRRSGEFTYFCRRLAYGICASLRRLRNYIRSNHTKMKYCTWHGRLIIPLSSLVLQVTGESMFVELFTQMCQRTNMTGMADMGFVPHRC
jgi:WD40 repeat protein